MILSARFSGPMEAAFRVEVSFPEPLSTETDDPDVSASSPLDPVAGIPEVSVWEPLETASFSSGTDRFSSSVSASDKI